MSLKVMSVRLIAPVLSKEFLDNKGTINCRFPLKRLVGLFLKNFRKRPTSMPFNEKNKHICKNILATACVNLSQYLIFMGRYSYDS